MGLCKRSAGGHYTGKSAFPGSVRSQQAAAEEAGRPWWRNMALAWLLLHDPGRVHSGGPGIQGPCMEQLTQAGLGTLELAHSFRAAPL